MAKETKSTESKNVSVSVDIPETNAVDTPETDTVLGSEFNPVHVKHVYDELPDIATLQTHVEPVDFPDEEKMRQKLWPIRDLAEHIALRIMANPDSRIALEGSILAHGKAGGFDSQAELLAHKSYGYAKQLLAGLENENNAEVEARLSVLSAQREADSQKDESTKETSDAS